MYTPEIDSIIDSLPLGNNRVDREIHNKLIALYKAVSPVKHQEENDNKRELWLCAPRGTLENFGEFEAYKEEGIVETHEEFEQLWKDYYPDENKWYGFSTAEYQDELFFYIDLKLLFSIKRTEKPEKPRTSANNEVYGFLDCLKEMVQKETERLKKDADAYNIWLEQNLPFCKRFGKIKRKDLWNIFGDQAVRPDKNLGPEIIEKLKLLVKQMNKPKTHRTQGDMSGSGTHAEVPKGSAMCPQIKEDLYVSPDSKQEMTADYYFNCCGICYDANDYFTGAEKELSPRERYLHMADGRDAGLRNIDGGSTKAFNDWYTGNDRLGGHPWEICRGGNSTHISLAVCYTDPGWELMLAGSSVGRAEETVRMAVALHEQGIPFILEQAEEILRMVTGEDYVGIVPDYITPRYCGHYFPDKDRIIDFMQLGSSFYLSDDQCQMTSDSRRLFAASIDWYHLDRIEKHDKSKV